MAEAERQVGERLSEQAVKDAEACIALAVAMENGDRSDQAALLEVAQFAGTLARHVVSLARQLAEADQRIRALEAETQLKHTLNRNAIDKWEKAERQLVEAERENGRLRKFLVYLRPHLEHGSTFDRAVLVRDLDAVIAGALNPPEAATEIEPTTSEEDT